LTAAIGFPDLSLASLNGAMPHVGQTPGVCFTQPTPTQIKVGPINFWPKAKGVGGASTSTGAPNTRCPTILASSPLAPNRARPAHSIPSLSPPARRQIKAASLFVPLGPCGRLRSWVARAERQRQSTSAHGPQAREFGCTSCQNHHGSRRSEPTREKWTLSIAISGVGCGNSYCSS
jgi:hypothetical protein